MTNHVSLLLEAAAARRRLAQLFQSELGRGNRLSTAIVASDLSHAARTGTQQNKPLLQDARRWLFIMPQDWTWWGWLVTACLLLIGLLGMPEAFLVALLLSIAQSVLFFARERALGAFPVQLRLAYTLLLIICLFLPIRWLFWLPAVGTFALVIFGYCLMARMLSLLPWNRTEPITADLVRRTFLSRPRPLDRADSVSSASCGVGLCSIEAQVEPGTSHGRNNSGRSHELRALTGPPA
jgi:hypothetical protein